MMLIDHREPDWVKYHDWGFRTEIETNMKVSDLLISGGVAIERKGINDFVSSMSQRLWEQLENLEHNINNDEDDIRAASVIVHGTVGDLSSRNMEHRKIEGIYGAITRAWISYGVSVIWVRERSQFIKLVKKAHDKAGTKSNLKKPHLSKRNFRDDRINVLYGVQGIGYDTAMNLLDEFGTLKAIANTSTKALQRADGVGPTTAKKIRTAFDGDGSDV